MKFNIQIKRKAWNKTAEMLYDFIEKSLEKSDATTIEQAHKKIQDVYALHMIFHPRAAPVEILMYQMSASKKQVISLNRPKSCDGGAVYITLIEKEGQP